MKIEGSRRHFVTQPLPNAKHLLFASLSKETDRSSTFFSSLIKKSKPGGYVDDNTWVGDYEPLPSVYGTTVRFLCVDYAGERDRLGVGNYLEIQAEGGLREIRFNFKNTVNAVANYIGDTIGIFGDDAKPDIYKAFYITNRGGFERGTLIVRIYQLTPAQKQEIKARLAKKEAPMITVEPSKEPQPLPRVYPWGYNKRFI